MTRGRMLGARLKLDPEKLRRAGFAPWLVAGVLTWKRDPEPAESTDNHDPGDEDRS